MSFVGLLVLVVYLASFPSTQTLQTALGPSKPKELRPQHMWVRPLHIRAHERLGKGKSHLNGAAPFTRPPVFPRSPPDPRKAGPPKWRCQGWTPRASSAGPVAVPSHRNGQLRPFLRGNGSGQAPKCRLEGMAQHGPASRSWSEISATYTMTSSQKLCRKSMEISDIT